ncbi:dolichyldiphosphatase 1 [Heterostelium album PN500]|uniref:Dolichyldiphosphatase n=1 Tax=Heterostelium pallidum (strain ATCC 26659 / Pp 5 / PN500) TaxID=670386 RepID=D3BKH4_HETP5|nr:dolichyldiphosphatase 1 [Heterostelium album PN500]EFA78404.1 dolichyldiphosphatase 1 [Heterostelium album PN500]|eukprot:XP_020430529.1 dolichyldiphosphatase 1 [Heterostelium album PN500]
MTDVSDLHTSLTFVELTTVHYSAEDPYGLLNAYITLTPLIIAVGAITLFVFRRDLRTAAVFGGLVLSESLNYVLKKSIKEHRPAFFSMYYPYTSLNRYYVEMLSYLFLQYNININDELRKQSYGMPSSHSQFMFFFATLMTLFLIRRRIKICQYLRSVIIIFLYFLAIMVAYSRYHLYYHTAKQVIFGSIVGMILAPIYFCLVEFIFVPHIFPLLINSSIGRYFYLRDTSSIENLMEFEYNNAMRETQKKTKKTK